MSGRGHLPPRAVARGRASAGLLAQLMAPSALLAVWPGTANLHPGPSLAAPSPTQAILTGNQADGSEDQVALNLISTPGSSHIKEDVHFEYILDASGQYMLNWAPSWRRAKNQDRRQGNKKTV